MDQSRVIEAIGAVILACATLMNAITNFISLMQSRANGRVATRLDIRGEQTQATLVKVDANVGIVREQSNGHTTALIALASRATDPVPVAKAAAEIIATAHKVADKENHA